MKILLITILFSLNANADFIFLAGNLDDLLIERFSRFLGEVQCEPVITSGHRSEEHNKRVGGAKNSYHLKGQALDLFFYDKCGKSLKEIVVIAQKYFNGVIVYKKHIHVDIRDKKYFGKGSY